MKNIVSQLAKIPVFLSLGMVLLAGSVPVWAEAGGKNVPVKILDAVVRESSNSVVEPDVFKKKPKEADPFFDQLRRKRQKFFRKQREQRLDFLEAIKKKDLESRELQEELAKFHQEDIEDVQKFVRKQRKKIDKHMEKKGIH